MSTERENFVGLSSALLGIGKALLAPSIDPIDLPSQFLAYIRPKLTEAQLNDLLSQYASLVADQLEQWSPVFAVTLPLQRRRTEKSAPAFTPDSWVLIGVEISVRNAFLES